ncbi:MAG: 50S ribosomal protein L23 [Spirochaetes bacterium]|nr:50S ribosomal protein L23 [Spirochaetota bacterium]NMB64336.1 50S ribosomal protein L23 [Spirochaetota bacterium]HOJ27997.1 50S ribosomal protein L23 [Spirochaetota bacterium]HOM09045.1 50S ribosomal protein L23 [Spirochaetota bacterium]HPP48825.1 50S ribosomal protein L23 [Spirochaetota bacterium]
MDVNDIIIRPVITEKATELAKQNKYVFRVHKKANKDMIEKAISSIFGVTPVKVNVMIVRGKRKRVRYNYGYTASWKKAIVTLKEGDKIEVFESK